MTNPNNPATCACPVCGRTVKITKTGKVARHGFGSRDGRGRSRNSLMASTCYGGGVKPEASLQKAVDIVTYYIDCYTEEGNEQPMLAGPLMKQRDEYLAKMNA